jgi:hypothetical protein
MAELLFDQRNTLDSRTFVEIVVWRLPRPAGGSIHSFKYRLALVVDEVCVLRYDNEAGKGDHRHLQDKEVPYSFVDLDTLMTDFWHDVEEWKR